LKLLMAFLILLSSNWALAKVCGRIESLRGQIEVLRIKKGHDPKSADHTRAGILARKRMKLSCSDIVVSRKSARAKIRLVNRAMMTMGPNSRIEIKNYLKETSKDPDQLKLTYGKVRALFKSKKKVPKKLPKKGETAGYKKTSRWRIKTPSVVAGVRGTDFYIGFDPRKALTEQATIEGEVEVEDVATGEKVVVKPGQQVSVEEVKKDQKKKKRKKMEIKPIQPETKEVIRQTSAIARNDRDFVTKEAVQLLGKPKSWKLPPDEVPLDLKGLKEEF